MPITELDCSGHLIDARAGWQRLQLGSRLHAHACCASLAHSAVAHGLACTHMQLVSLGHVRDSVPHPRPILHTKHTRPAPPPDYYLLRRFLRARTYDLEKAMAMFLNNIKFRSEFMVDTILTDFYFGERDKFLLAYPQGYHKTDKMVRVGACV